MLRPRSKRPAPAVGLARSARHVAQRQVDYERWDAWRREGRAFGQTCYPASALDADFKDLARLPDDGLKDLRRRTGMLVHSLDRLSAVALDRKVGDWSRQLAGLFGSLALLLPSYPWVR